MDCDADTLMPTSRALNPPQRKSLGQRVPLQPGDVSQRAARAACRPAPTCARSSSAMMPMAGTTCPDCCARFASIKSQTNGSGRRTRAAGILPNEASCLRLVSALLMEISETWETGRIYLSFVKF